jgi:hypothetical protein
MIIAPGAALLCAIGAQEKLPLFSGSCADRRDDQEETTMIKLSLIGVAAVAATAAFAAPAFAEHRAAHFVNTYAYASRCTHEAGNPYSKEEDYVAWSAWRARGGWDDRLDPNCGMSRSGF